MTRLRNAFWMILKPSSFQYLAPRNWYKEGVGKKPRRMRKHRQGQLRVSTRGVNLMLSAIASSICNTNIQIKFELRNTLLQKVINNAKLSILWLRKIKNGFIIDKGNELIAEYRRLIEFAGDLSHFDAQMVREFVQELKVHQNGLNDPHCSVACYPIILFAFLPIIHII